MNEEQLLTFCSYIVKLKEKLKCIICLDIIKDVAELDCGHKFCSGCFEEYKSNQKNISCPYCKRVIKRRSTIFKDEYYNKLGEFVFNVCNTLRRTYNYEVEEIIRSRSEKVAVTKSKAKKSKDIIKNVEKPSTSKIFREPVKCISKPSSEEDAFDVLVRKTEPKSNKLLINKTGTRRYYDRKKEKKVDSKYKILDFDDDQNKAAVLRWLTDTRNKFDRLTQTQINEDHDESIPIIDLTSVSQVQQNNSIPEQLMKVKHKNRAKSLDIEIKKTLRDKKRYSDGSVVDVTENYYIEETNIEEEKVVKKVEENILMHFIEDQYLDKLENELINENELKPKNSSKEDCNSSGWARVGKIARTLKKKEKAPKKLNITIQSSQSSNLKRDKDKGNSRNETKSVSEGDNCLLKVQIEKMKDAQFMLESKKQSDQTGEYLLQLNHLKNTRPSETISDPRESDIGGSEKNKEEVTKTYDLQDVEKYIENNIELINPDNSFDDKNNDSTGKHKIKILEVVVVRVDPNNVSNPEIEDPFILPTQKWNTSEEDNSYSRKRKIDVLDDIESKAITDLPLPISKSNTLDEFNCEENTKKNIDEKISDNPFLMLTQNNPQELRLVTDTEMNILEDAHLSNVSDIIDALQKNLVKCFDINKTGSSKLLDQMKSYLNRLRLLTTNAAKECVDDSTQTDFESSNKQTQTILECSVKSTQTELEIPSEPKSVEVRDVEVQYSPEVTSQNKKNASEGIQGPEILNASSSNQPALESILVEPEFPENDNSEGLRKNIDLSEIITQNTKNALQSFITDPEIIQSSSLEEPVPPKNALESIIVDSEVPKEFKNTITDPEMTKPSSSKESDAYLEITEKSTTAEQAVKNRLISVGKSQNQIFTCSLDNFSFETQDLAKNIVNTVASQKRANSQNDIILVNNEKDNSQIKASSVLMCTLDSNSSRKAKKKLIYVQEKFNKSKRPLSDSDSEEIIVPKRLCNRFIRDDLTVEFDVNTENPESQRSKGSNTGASEDNADYEGYLDKFMKKYDSDGVITTPEKKGESSITYKNELTENRTHNVSDAEMDCDAIVAKVNENVQKLAKHNDTSKSSYHTASQDSKKSSRESNRYSEMSDIIGETESERMEPLRKKTRNGNSEFRDVQFIDSISCTPKKNEVKKSKPCDDICYDLEDSLDNADFVNIKIDIEDEPLKREKNIEEDLFSDDDIVETTPQKRKNSMGKRSHHTPDHFLEDLDFDFDALPPPIGFQDEPAQIENENSDGEITIVEAETTVKELKQSLTPDGLSQFRMKDDDLDTSKVKTDIFSTHNPIQRKVNQSQISTRNLLHSTPLSQRGETRDTLGFSPITGNNSIIEQALSSKNTLTSALKLPTSKSTIMTSTPKQKSIWNYVRSQEHSEKESARPKPCIACTRLSKEQMLSISSLTDRNLATYSNVFDKKVTHMIVSVDDNNCLKDYTMKFVAAVAAGIWVLRFEWVQECLRSNSIVSEEHFEVLDDSGMPGPKASRLTRKESLLFEGFKFFCAGPFYTVVQRDIEEVIKMQGGKLLSSMDKLTEKDGRFSLIITEAKSTPDFQVYENWLELYKTVTVDMEWLSRCVGRYKILNIRRYIWFSDDNLGNLGYPDYLMESIESSSEQYSMSEKY